MATATTVRATAPTSSAKSPTRVVRLKRGEQPTHSSMTGFQRWAWQTFRARVLAPRPTRRSTRTW